MFVARCAVDLDGDGVGEVGTLGELTGVDALRGGSPRSRLQPALLSSGMRPAAPHGTARRSQYGFRLYLPGRDGAWLRVDENPGARDVDAAETRWCAFAWPLHHDGQTTRTFRIDETGRITSTEARVDPTVLPRQDVSGWVEVR